MESPAGRGKKQLNWNQLLAKTNISSEKVETTICSRTERRVGAFTCPLRLSAGRPARLQSSSRRRVAAGAAGLQPNTNCFFPPAHEHHQQHRGSLTRRQFVAPPWGCRAILRNDLIEISSGGWDTEEIMDFTLCPSSTLTHFPLVMTAKMFELITV